jgi:ribosome-binding factor A
MKQRAERMARIVRRVVSSELLKLMPQAHISLTQIDVSDDMRYATIWVSSFSQSKTSLESLVDEISSHREELQQALAQQLETKFTPSLRFKPDPGKEHAQRVDRLLGDIS